MADIQGTRAAKRLAGTDGDGTMIGGEDAGTLYTDSGMLASLSANGTESSDEIEGTAGDDTLYGLGGDDIIRGLAGRDDLYGGAGADQIDGGADADFLEGDAGDDVLTGGDGHDLLEGGTGNDRVDGGAGNDHILYDADASAPNLDVVIGGDGGIDQLSAGFGAIVAPAALTYSLTANPLGGTDGWFASGPDQRVEFTGIERLTIQGTRIADDISGTENADTFHGERGDDILRGLGGADTLIGNEGLDTLIGGQGDDFYQLTSAEVDLVVELEGEGIDQVFTTLASYTLPDNVEKLSGSSFSAGQTLIGNGLANTIFGGSGNDILDGRGGADALNGGAGNDIYYIDNAGDTYIEQSGVDEVRTSLAVYAMGQFIELLTGTLATGQILTGWTTGNTIQGAGGDDQINGDGGDDTLYGGAGNDQLDGGTGNDAMRGEAGNDVYTIDSAADSVVENAGEGIDKVLTALATYTLAANVENLTGTAATAQTLRGNALDNVVAGGAGGDTILLQDVGVDKASGNGGNDFVFFGATMTAADEADGGAGTDTLLLQGDYSAGLTFAAGTMTGFEYLHLLGRANTRYGGSSVTPNAYNLTTVDANVGPTGWLTVDASNLAANESLVFDGSAEIDGRFWLIGGAAADRLTGSAGNDIMQGNAGADVLIGGLGNDLYIADNGDLIVETADGGSDSVDTSSATFTLSANIETLNGRSTGGQALTGNSGANTIEGESGGDTLDGGGGTDTLKGNGGNDYLRVSAPGSVWAQGGAGSDILVIDWSAATAAIVNSYNPSFAVGPDGFDVGFTDWGAYNVSANGVEGVDITTGSGNDNIKTGPGNDRVILNGGDDLLDAGNGTNIADGGTGSDGLDLDLRNATGAIVWNIAASSHNGVAGTYTNFEYFAELQTGSGNDSIVTGAGERQEFIYTYLGNDTVTVFGGRDTVFAGAGLDTLIIDYSAATEAIMTLGIIEAADGMGGTFGDSGAHKVNFSGIDRFVFTGGTGNDNIITSGGDDVMSGGEGDDQFDANGGNDSLTGGAGSDILRGGDGNDILVGGVGNDTLNGGAGVDSMTGGTGNDLYVIDSLSDVATELEGEGTDRISTSLATYVLGSAFEELAGSSAAGQTLTGNAGDNVINAWTGNDIIDGGAGADRMTGIDGDDIYYVDNVGDVVVEVAHVGIDEVRTSLAAYSLGDNVEKLTGISALGQTLNGNGGDNEIAGGGGNDLIDGRAGGDSMAGGQGDDVFIVDNAGDTIVELAGAGTDEVRTALAAYTLAAANVEVLRGTSSTGQTLTGNSSDNQITGGGGNDVIAGGAGADSLTGGDGNDMLYAGAISPAFDFPRFEAEPSARPLLDTGVEADVLNGGGGDDWIFAGAGDTVEGGDGIDTLFISFKGSSSGVTADFRGLGGGGGATAVIGGATIDSIEIVAWVEGSEYGDSIALPDFDVGNFPVYGLGGDDVIVGGVSTGNVYGGDGGDTIDNRESRFGGFLYGGAGNDVITDGENGQHLWGGDGDDRIFGNGGSDYGYGGAGADVIDGGSFDDVLNGDDANDTLYGNRDNDKLYGGDGDDTLYGDYTPTGTYGGFATSSDELHGGAGADSLYGNEGVDLLEGGDGDDRLDGGTSGDQMCGGAGNDLYLADSSDQLFENSGEGVDEVRTGAAAYTLGANFETLTATGYGATPLLLRGNALDNVVTTEVGGAIIFLQDGGADVAYGATNSDTFYFGAAFGAGDRVDGSTGSDSVVLQGAYGALTLTAGTMDGIQTLALLSAGDDRFGGAAAGSYSYDISVAADFSSAIPISLPFIGEEGELLIDASGLAAGESLHFDASDADPALGYFSVKGGSGADHLVGSAGGDSLMGGAGSDTIEGGAGDDYLDDTGGQSTILRGGEGDDILWFGSTSWGTLTLEGGDGNDRAVIDTDSAGAATLDMGAGDDRVEIRFLYGGTADVTLGSGQDTLTVSGEAIWQAGFRMGAIVVADFDAGAGGDRFEWPADLAAAFPGWAPGTNAFAAGYARLVQDGADTLLQVSPFANGDFITLVRFENVAPGDFTGENFGGWSPLPVTGGSGADQLVGTTSSDYMFGEGGNDVFRLQSGGDDIVYGGDGLDTFFFIGALTAADVVNGGAGVDTVVVQGPYGSLTLTANITQIENVSILGGNNTNFGEPGTNRYDYVLTTNDANFAAGVQARINGSALLAGEDFTFDGSAETNASFVVYGGKGVDTLTGGLGNDIFFYAEERFASGDTVNGGAGYDGMFLRGNYTIDFNAPGYTGLFTNIENLTLTSATDERYARGGGTEFDYNLTLSNAIVGAGQELTVSGALLMATETMVLDGSQEQDGLLRLFGGKAADILKGGGQVDLLHGNLGADILAGGGGADAFRYQNVAESNSAAMDHILDFTPGTDRIELDRIDANSLAAGDQAFTWIGSNVFSGSAGQLRAYQSSGAWFVEGDVNGDGAADLVIALTLQGPEPLAAGDFFL